MCKTKRLPEKSQSLFTLRNKGSLLTLVFGVLNIIVAVETGTSRWFLQRLLLGGRCFYEVQVSIDLQAEGQ